MSALVKPRQTIVGGGGGLLGAAGGEEWGVWRAAGAGDT